MGTRHISGVASPKIKFRATLGGQAPFNENAPHLLPRTSLPRNQLSRLCQLSTSQRTIDKLQVSLRKTLKKPLVRRPQSLSEKINITVYLLAVQAGTPMKHNTRSPKIF